MNQYAHADSHFSTFAIYEEAQAYADEVDTTEVFQVLGPYPCKFLGVGTYYEVIVTRINWR